MSNRLRSGALVVAAVVLWIPAVGMGLRSLLRYSDTPGQAATPPPDWPRGASIRPASERATLLLFAHPQCPCSQATIGQLAEIVAHAREKLEIYVFFYAPEQKTSEWVRAGLWQSAAIIPGVHLIEDNQGIETRRFGAATSGQALLYDAGGHLVFNGGITAARGHSGENDGRDAILSVLLDGVSRRGSTPVFGCSLLGGDQP
jgi:hypothetical protein